MVNEQVVPEQYLDDYNLRDENEENNEGDAEEEETATQEAD